MKENYEALELENIKQEISHYCAFSLGHKEIMNMMPRYELLHVKRDLKRCSEAIECVVRYGTMPFGGVYDLREAVNHAMKNRILPAKELRQCAEQSRAVMAVWQYMKNIEKDKEALYELTDSLTYHKELAEAIEKCISINYEIMDNASPALKSIRKTIKQCEADLSSQTASFIQNNASKLMDTITTMRNDRVCVLVKISEKNTIRGYIHGESASGQTAYVEPECLIHANNRLQAAKSAEQEEIERILYELSQLVKKSGYTIIGNCETFGILDSVFAKALWAKETNSCVAKIDEKGNRLYFKNARHPLIDPKKVVSNTYEMAHPKRILMITGSNTGGKTVTLKTIGLFVLMSLSGMPIPCEEAVLPMFDRVFVDIGDEQSIEASLSTFSAHLSKLAHICDTATSSSLILLDELGSGTDPKEGEALAVAVLDYLRNKNAMIVATTHYSQLKSYGAKWEEVLLASVEFDVEKMQPTYRFISGTSGQSNAFEIARRFGLSEKILAHAMQIKEESQTDQDKLMIKLDRLIEENLSRSAKLEAELSALKNEREQFEAKKAQFENTEARLLDEAKNQAWMIVEEAKEESSKVIAQLKESKEAKPHELLQIKSQLNELVEEVDEVEESAVEYHVGDYVHIKKYNYYGEVLEVTSKNITVMANGLRMKLKPEDLALAKKQVQKKKQVSFSKSLRSSFSLECNVIGQRVSEALAVIDKYLDNALLANVTTVRLVHGHGTGALRTAIHDYLKRNPRVESYRMGGQGEGGLGATVVTLKSKGKKNGIRTN